MNRHKSRQTSVTLSHRLFAVCRVKLTASRAMHTYFPIIFTLLLGVYSVESVIRVTGYVGGSAEIRCPYDAGYEIKSKYLCRGECPAAIFSDNKDIPVKTEERQTTASNGRFTLHDDTTARVFTVTITGLTAGDFVMYRCGIKTGYGNWDVYTQVALTVEDPTIKLREECKEEADVDCMLKFINKMYTAPALPLKVVSSLLDVLLEAPAESLVWRGEAVLQSTETLVSKLVEPTRNTTSSRFRTNTTEGEVLSIGPDALLTGVRRLGTAKANLDIDLPGIARNNNGSASVVLLVYNSMQEVLNASFFKTETNQRPTTMSNVMSVVLPNASNKTLPNPVNLTIYHERSASNEEVVSCVYWNVSAWIKDGCYVSATNSTHTVCLCDHLSTFALIVSIDPMLESDPVVEILNTIFMLIGLVFLTLALMTFALCRWNPRVSNAARLNLCVCLLLAHALFLLTQSFIHRIRIHAALCKTLAGVLHFLFLCSFVWMSIEAVMLFLSVRKLRQVKANDRAGLHWKVTLPIGYGIPLLIMGVSAGVWSDGYGSEKCWLRAERGFIWSFRGPVFFILAGNIILFIIIIITIYSTLKEARSDVSNVKYTRVLAFKVMAQCMVLGCPWVLGIFSTYSPVLEVLFLFLTSQQGTAIFLIHCLLNTEVRRQYRTWWQKFRPYGHLAATSTGSGTASVSVTLQPQNTTTLPPAHNVTAPTIQWAVSQDGEEKRD